MPEIHQPSDAPGTMAPHPAEFYVGYRPVPLRIKVFLRRLVPAAIALVLAFGLLWAFSQESPGDGRWRTDRPEELRGVLITRPYPMLLTTDEEGKPEYVLLVGTGKHGPGTLDLLDGRPVLASGVILQRDGRRLLELHAEPHAWEPAPSELSLDVPPRRERGTVTLRGEIIDPKCYLGAMKPGEGKTHKECATLCIRGGIPPMFVTRDDARGTTYYLLHGADGGPVDPGLYPYIADRIEITGTWSTSANLNFLEVQPHAIRRR